MVNTAWRSQEGDMYKKLVVPLDGSEFSECSLEHVTTLAQGCQIPSVVLLNVVEPANKYTTYSGVSQETFDEIRKQFLAQNKEYLDKVADRLNKEGINASPVIIEGKPAEEILNYAEKEKTDLIVMSTHGSSGFSRWAFGSVADRVVRHSTVPVLVIAPTGCRK
jgi:nucleotide-binding universal stress UspA family protein